MISLTRLGPKTTEEKQDMTSCRIQETHQRKEVYMGGVEGGETGKPNMISLQLTLKLFLEKLPTSAPLLHPSHYRSNLNYNLEKHFKNRKLL